MSDQRSSPVNDPGTVRAEYATEDRFLARRLTAWAELRGPLVEDATVAAVGEAAPARVLDVGCGTGDFTARVRDELGVELVALDLSPRVVELTSSRGVPALVGAIESLPFAGATFDCVLANRVLYHLGDLDAGLVQIRRVLRPGGRLVAVTYGMDHLRELWSFVGESPIAPTFAAETGGAPIASRFERVERRDVTGTARFASREAIVGLLRSYGAFAEVDLVARLGEVSVPLDASYRHSIFVARTSPAS